MPNSNLFPCLFTNLLLYLNVELVPFFACCDFMKSPSMNPMLSPCAKAQAHVMMLLPSHPPFPMISCQYDIGVLFHIDDMAFDSNA